MNEPLPCGYNLRSANETKCKSALWPIREVGLGRGGDAASALEGARPAGLRTVFILTRDLVGGQLTLRAMSLVGTTLLSIVPLLALSFSVLKAFGVYNQIEPMLLKFVEPLGKKATKSCTRFQYSSRR